MGKTVIEKIIEHNTGKEVKPGDIVTVNVDRVMIHDIFIPFVAEKFKEMGFDRVFAPSHDLEDVCQLLLHDVYQRHGIEPYIEEDI